METGRWGAVPSDIGSADLGQIQTRDRKTVDWSSVCQTTGDSKGRYKELYYSIVEIKMSFVRGPDTRPRIRAGKACSSVEGPEVLSSVPRTVFRTGGYRGHFILPPTPAPNLEQGLETYQNKAGGVLPEVSFEKGGGMVLWLRGSARGREREEKSRVSGGLWEITRGRTDAEQGWSDCDALID